MPRAFHDLYPTTRVIVDTIEIPIAQPVDAYSQNQTFSNLSKRNTVKAMVGITPNGAVSYISDCYPGSTSDRRVVEDSNLYKHASRLFDEGDSIMADAKVAIEDLFAPFGVSVNLPATLEEKRHAGPKTKRMLVVRAISFLETYKILNSELSLELTKLCSQIAYVTFSLVNLQKTMTDAKILEKKRKR